MTVAITKIDTLVVGAGQAGVAMSEHLSKQGVPHLVLERSRIAERWRTGRWDSLVANGPAWHDRFPGLHFDDVPADGFAPKERVADYFEAYARKFNAPIRTGVDVTSVVRNEGRPGFTVHTSEGVIEANRVVAATGPFQKPVIPAIAPKDTALHQIHSADYRNRDFCWWLGVLGEWDQAAMKPGREHVTIAVSGAHGGKTIDFRELAQQGMTLVGLTHAFDGTVATFQPNLVENLARGDENYLALLDAADAYIERNGLDLPLEPEARRVFPDAECIKQPILTLDLAEAGITSIIWATGFAVDYSWLQVDAFDAAGKPQHQRGVSSEAGIYFLGLPWQSRRGSSFIWGVWHDAKYVADHIAIQRQYLEYREAAPVARQSPVSA